MKATALELGVAASVLSAGPLRDGNFRLSAFVHVINPFGAFALHGTSGIPSKKDPTMSRFAQCVWNRIPWSTCVVVAAVVLSNFSLAQGTLDSQLKSVLATAGF